MAGRMVDTVKVFLSSNLLNMQNLVAICHTVRTYVAGPKKVRGCCSQPLGVETPVPMCVTVLNWVTLGHTIRA